MLLERHQQIMDRAGPVGYGQHQAHAILAAGLGWWQHAGQAHDHKAGAVKGFVLHRLCGDMQTEFGSCALAGECCPCWVGGSQPCAFGVAGYGAALRMGQVGVEPLLALGQRLRMGQHDLHAIGRRAAAQQVVAHHQADLAHDVQR